MGGREVPDPYLSSEKSTSAFSYTNGRSRVDQDAGLGVVMAFLSLLSANVVASF